MTTTQSKTDTKRILLETCVDSIEGALAAQQGGADRVELCGDLFEGGITPSPGTILVARQRLKIQLNVLIRPRGGDSCYSDAEFEVMKRDVEFAKGAGADGVVLGVLKEDGSVDVERTGALVKLARPMSVTFHRIFDVTRDPFEALEAVISLGVERILTSGQEASVLEGLDLLAQLVNRAGERIIIMPGGGVTERNLPKIVAGTGAREFHASCSTTLDGRMRHRNSRVFMGGALRTSEYGLRATDTRRVGTMAAILNPR